MCALPSTPPQPSLHPTLTTIPQGPDLWQATLHRHLVVVVVVVTITMVAMVSAVAVAAAAAVVMVLNTIAFDKTTTLSRQRRP